MPPYEAIFMGDGDDQIELIQGVNQLYRDNGLVVSNNSNERPDYIGLEFSFLQHLAEAEAQAWEQGDADLARSRQETAHMFLRQHLGAWISTFTVPALRFAKTDFYHGFLQLCQGVVAEAAA
jgi:TorA maturation chaperone TorD